MMKHQLVELVSTKLMKANSRDYNKKISNIKEKKQKKKFIKNKYKIQIYYISTKRI